MSTDTIETFYTCPCGNGEFVESYWSDDWFRSGSNKYLNCETCNKIYKSHDYSEYEIAKGKTSLGSNYYNFPEEYYKTRKKLRVESR